VVGVSTDAQATNDRFRKSLDLPFPLVGDPDGAIGKAYGVRWPIVGVHRRASFVIGEDASVREAFWSELDAAEHVAQACRVLGA
jgi:peroxiredoxin